MLEIDLIQRRAGHHLDHGNQFYPLNVEVGMPFPHVSDRLV
jgi:hypothetical protein